MRTLKREIGKTTTRNYLDALCRLKRFMSTINGQCPNDGELKSISSDLYMVLDKLLRVRSLYPSSRLDLSKDIWRLLYLAKVVRKD